MLLNNKSYKEIENEKQKGKRRYIERRIQEKEATREIETYKEEKETFPERDDERTK